MFQPPTPLDIRVNHQLVGQATDVVTADEINERLDVMANWMVSEDATRQSLAWADWLKIARPDQLPPPDPNWREWKISMSRGSGKTRAAAEWIASQGDDADLRVHIIAKTQELARHSARVLLETPSWFGENVKLIRCHAADNLDSLTGAWGRNKTIFWMEELIFLPPGINVGKFHSFIKQMLRAPRTRVIWSG